MNNAMYQDLLKFAFNAYLPILIGGAAVLLTCLFCLSAARHSWPRLLCIISLAIGFAITGPLLLLLLGLFLQGAADSGWYHGEAGMAGAYLFLALIPVTIEFAGLLVVVWRLQFLRRSSKMAAKGNRVNL